MKWSQSQPFYSMDSSRYKLSALSTFELVLFYLHESGENNTEFRLLSLDVWTIGDVIVRQLNHVWQYIKGVAIFS